MKREDIQRLFDFLYYQEAHYPLERSFGYRMGEEERWWSTAQLIRDAEALAAGLIARGHQRGDKVAIVDYINRPEWVIADLACQMAGLVSIPVYPTISSREYEYIFNDAGVQAVFVGGQDLPSKIQAATQRMHHPVAVYSLDAQDEGIHWRDLLSEDLTSMQAVRDSIASEDLATIIYTSGTTGYPKGVMLNHASIVFNVKTILPLIPIEAGMRGLSFLPLCHIFERAVSYAYMYAGVTTLFTTPERLGGDEGDLRTFQPHFFTTVPRLLEKVYEKIYNKGLALSPLKRALFFWALGLTRDYEYDKSYTGWAALKKGLANRLIFSKWREALGGHIRGIITGAAPCPVHIARTFSYAGIPVREGYGQTETAPGISFSHFAPGKAMLGTVGLPIEGIEVRIDEQDAQYGEGEGEIMVKGPNVMMGYYNKPEENARAFREEDGHTWLCTGDVGRWHTNEQGTRFLVITDRKKELLKTSGGKYVAPAPIESKLRESFLVEQAMVVGESRKYVSALIVPAIEALQDWCRHKQINWSHLAEMLHHPAVLDKYERIIHAVNPNFGKVEQIKKYVLLPQAWEPVKEDGSESELTPTLKLKRRVIMDKYAREIESLYL
jgi:long-chain acyl-CoA synthetase